MEINASYRTCIVGKVLIYDGLRVMLTEINGPSMMSKYSKLKWTHIYK